MFCTHLKSTRRTIGQCTQWRSMGFSSGYSGKESKEMLQYRSVDMSPPKTISFSVSQIFRLYSKVSTIAGKARWKRPDCLLPWSTEQFKFICRSVWITVNPPYLIYIFRSYYDTPTCARTFSKHGNWNLGASSSAWKANNVTKQLWIPTHIGFWKITFAKPYSVRFIPLELFVFIRKNSISDIGTLPLCGSSWRRWTYCSSIGSRPWFAQTFAALP